MIDGFDRHLRSLVGSWRAMVSVHEGGRVVELDGGIVCSCPPEPLLDNALLFDAAALPEVRDLYHGAPHAIWTRDGEHATAMVAAGYRRDEVTVPMTMTLAGAALPVAPTVPVEADVPVDVVATLNGVDPAMLRGVPGLRAYATAARDSCAVLLGVDDDVDVSFVATKPEARRRGAASAVLAAALLDAREHGFRSASLQATALGTGVYRRLGFTPVGTWQEWTPL